jgi:hypothetical protein
MESVDYPSYEPQMLLDFLSKWIKSPIVWVAVFIAGLATFIKSSTTILNTINSFLYPTAEIAIHDPFLAHLGQQDLRGTDGYIYSGKMMEVKLFVNKTSVPPIGPCYFVLVADLLDDWRSIDSISLGRGPSHREVLAHFEEGHFNFVPQNTQLQMICGTNIVASMPVDLSKAL